MAIPAFHLAPALRAGKPCSAAGAACPIRSSPRRFGAKGFAAVTLDSQHGLWDIRRARTAVAAVRQGGRGAGACACRSAISRSFPRALDFGAEGIHRTD